MVMGLGANPLLAVVCEGAGDRFQEASDIITGVIVTRRTWTLYDLFYQLNHAPQLTPGQFLYLLVELSWAVEQLHARGIVHGDIKPSNIVVYWDEESGRYLVEVREREGRLLLGRDR
jgi:hypothetical protein